jgi:hypothetical protein
MMHSDPIHTLYQQSPASVWALVAALVIMYVITLII